MATYNSDSDLSLLCDRLDSWIRFWLLSLVLALGFGLGSQLWIRLLDSVSRIRPLFSFSRIRSLFTFSRIRSLAFGLGS